MSTTAESTIGSDTVLITKPQPMKQIVHVSPTINSNQNCIPNNLKDSIHHCQLILSYWCRVLDLDSLSIQHTLSIICHTVISYRGPGAIIAFSSNARLSSIEIYNSITNTNINKHDTAPQISAKLSIKPVHINMKFTPNSNTNKITRTWHPTLCATLDYHYLYRIGGADPLKGPFGDSSANVDVFDIYHMQHTSLPCMTHKRAKCSATLLPPTIPFHDYHDTDTEDERSTPNLQHLLQEIKSTQSTDTNDSESSIPRALSPTPPLCAPVPMAPIAPNALSINTNRAPIALAASTSSPTSDSPPCEPPNPAPLPSMIPDAPLPLPLIGSKSTSASVPPLYMNTSAVYGGRSRKNSTLKQRFVKGEYPEYCLFVSGGLDGSKLHKKCEIFYPFEGSWNPVMSMKQARCGHIAQYMGCTQWKCLLSSGQVSMSITEWKDISDLTTKVFVCGGRREHGNGITSCECFDIESNKWRMCQRAPFTNHGYQSGCWWSNKQCVAIISDPMDGNTVATYKPDVNKWNVIKTQTQMQHFYPLIGTLWLFGEEYLYIVGDDYKCKNLEIYDERNGKWIPIGISYNVNKEDQTLTQKYDQLLQLTRHQQYDAFASVS
eukprot:18471_1